jgi:hypothetical protein
VSAQTRRGLGLLAAAGVLGILGDVLLGERPFGLDVFLWTLGFVVALAALLRFLHAPLGHGRRWMVGPLLLFAALFAWRDSPWLQALDLLGIAVAVSLGALREPAARVHTAALADYARAAGRAGAATLLGVLELVVDDMRWSEVQRTTRSRSAGPVAKGAALALPLLVLFGALFAAADAVFQHLLQGAVPDVSNPARHLVIVLSFAWASAGLLRGLLAPEEEPAPFDGERKSPEWTLGRVEAAVVVAALDVLFLAFVLVQLRYLFGGRAHVMAQTGLTYAQYARRGFFELVVVATLVLPLVLVLDWSLRRERPRQLLLFRVLAALLLVFLAVVMASALQRMRLYQREFGLTELRVYTTGFMLWLGLVAAWLGATVLRGRHRRFAVGALVSGFVAILAANALNPDALIARTNLDRPRVDVHYLGGLSDDAVPTLVSRLPSLPPALRADLAAELRSRSNGTGDWRTWNLSRSNAADVLERLSR